MRGELGGSFGNWDDLKKWTKMEKKGIYWFGEQFWADGGNMK